MPSPDPNQKMEDLLRACARKRREEAGAPFELSPDVRARLHEEVRRALGKPAAAPPPRWGLSLANWLRLAVGGAVAALVILMVWINTPPRKSTPRFAKAETWASNVRNISSAPPPATPAPAPAAPVAAPLAPVPAPAAPASSAAAVNAPAAAVPAPATSDMLAMERSRSLGGAGTAAEADKSNEPPTPAISGDLAANGTTSIPGGGMTNVAARGGRGGRGGGAARGPGAGGGGIGGAGGGGGGGGRGGRRGGAGGGFGGGGNAGLAGANPASQPAPPNPVNPANPVEGMAAASPALPTASNTPAATRRMETAGAPSSSAIPNPQLAAPKRSDGGSAIPNPPSFAQQMVRSEPPASQNTLPARASSAKPPSSEVLASFQIERTGQQVRIVDADGSAYEGQVLGTNQVSFPGAADLKLAAPQPAGAASGFAFQVSGLNRKLNQNVTILGNCSNVPLPMGNSFTGGNMSNQSQALAGANTATQNASAPLARPPASQSQNMLDNSAFNYSNLQNTQNTQNAAFPAQFWRVTGQVQVGPSNRFDLDAATAAP